MLRSVKNLIGLHKLPADWRPILAADPGGWRRARQAAAGGPKVLVATGTGGNAAMTPVESLLAVALTLRGAEVHFLLCDAALPACLEVTTAGPAGDASFAKKGPSWN